VVASAGPQPVRPDPPDPPTTRLIRTPRARARLWSAESSYTATVTKKRERERDIVRELQEDAKWSMWTNTFGRQRGWGRPRSLPHGVGLRTYMLAAVLIVGTVVAAIGLIALLLNLD
jgi:hypothetical protein